MSNASDNLKGKESIGDYVVLGIPFDTHAVLKLGEMVWLESDSSIPEGLRGARTVRLAQVVAYDFLDDISGFPDAYTFANGKLKEYDSMKDNPRDVVVGVEEGTTEHTNMMLVAAARMVLSTIQAYDSGKYPGAKE